jgi:uncharacterized membrane protein YjjB (DUF3815 family)
LVAKVCAACVSAGVVGIAIGRRIKIAPQTIAIAGIQVYIKPGILSVLDCGIVVVRSCEQELRAIVLVRTHSKSFLFVGRLVVEDGDRVGVQVDQH